MAQVPEGASRGDAARNAGMDRQTLRDWVHRYNAEGVDGLCDHALNERGFRKLSARPKHPEVDTVAQGAFRQTLPRS